MSHLRISGRVRTWSKLSEPMFSVRWNVVRRNDSSWQFLSRYKCDSMRAHSMNSSVSIVLDSDQAMLHTLRLELWMMFVS